MTIQNNTPPEAPVAVAGSALAPSVEGRVALRFADLLPALKGMQPGDPVIECHHPEASGSPTNIGVVKVANRWGGETIIHAGLWTLLGDILVWTYQALEIDETTKRNQLRKDDEHAVMDW